MNFACLIFWFFPIFVTSLNEGEECVTENVNGKCLNIHECNYAISLVRARKRPQLCGFQGRDPIVCCPKPSSVQALNVGEKSANKCKEHYPPNTGNTFGYFGGTLSLPQQFPHMALLGYRGLNNTQWLCGGTLISENFVLTAAHCLYSQDFGEVSKVRLGELDIKSTTDDARPRDYEIAELFPHPDFKAPSHYNDIGLIKLDRRVEFSNYVRIACLYTEYMQNMTFFRLIGTGWGKTDFLADSGSSHLVKVDLNYIDHETCAKSYSDVSPRKLENGIIDETQVCAGAPDGRDACPGDSGGPLQFKILDIRPHHYVVGVTSFGKACGVQNSIGVYTRVAPFTAWIENIVWPYN